MSIPNKLLKIWRETKLYLGYSLFGFVVVWGFWNIPKEFWSLRLEWLLLAVILVLMLFSLQFLQVKVFLNHYDIKSDWIYPALFTARKGVLNTVLPAKSGTFILFNMITKTYQVKWYDYLIFIGIASLISILVSMLIAMWMFLPMMFSIIITLVCLSVLFILTRKLTLKSIISLLYLWTIAFLILFVLVLSFWVMLRGFGFNIELIQAAYFGIVLNILAQISITPGNMGVREIILGALSPYMELPISIGVIAGATFVSIRLLMYSLILLILEWRFKNILSVQKKLSLE